MKTPSPPDDLHALGGYLSNLPQSIQYMILVWTAEQPGFDCADKPRFCENCPQANLDSDGGLSADKDWSAFILSDSGSAKIALRLTQIQTAVYRPTKTVAHLFCLC